MTLDPFHNLLTAARNGCEVSFGQLLDTYRNYLLAVANASIDPELARKEGGSDLVQQTFAEAFESFVQFQGASSEELLAWLRRILLNNAADFDRKYRQTAIRDVARERPATDSRPIEDIAAKVSTPSSEVANLEEAQRLEAALARLPEEYRLVIEMRNRDQLRFTEIGERLSRSADAARMLWKRALKQLEEELTRE